MTTTTTTAIVHHHQRWLILYQSKSLSNRFFYPIIHKYFDLLVNRMWSFYNNISQWSGFQQHFRLMDFFLNISHPISNQLRAVTQYFMSNGLNVFWTKYSNHVSLNAIKTQNNISSSIPFNLSGSNLSILVCTYVFFLLRALYWVKLILKPRWERDFM